MGTYRHVKKLTGPMKERAGRKVTKTKKCTSRKISALLGAKVQKRVRIIKKRRSPSNSISTVESSGHMDITSSEGGSM
jgi:hypothetical protein